MLAVDDALALRAELEARGFEAPFILIRRSIGGLYMQAFARMYPRLIAELVSVDGGGREWHYIQQDRPQAAVDTARRTPRWRPGWT
jgi:pimeloyl-ACP methyl ester carboxylesterase